MAKAGRIGDRAVKEKNEGELCGPADQAAEHTFINGQRALRVGDGCTSGGSTWKATSGSSAVFIEGRPAVRQGDDTTHSGPGNVVRGSPDTKIGDGKGTAPDAPHDRSLTIVLKDGSDRDVKNAHLRITCPHPNQKQADQPFNGRNTARSLCAAATLDIFKSLERGDWDPVAVSGTKLTVTQYIRGGAYWYDDPAPEKKVLMTMDWKKEDQVHVPRVDPAAGDAAPAAGAAPAALAGPAPAGAPPAPAPAAAPAAPAAAAPAADTAQTKLFPTSGSTASVRIPTAYNWMELVYKAFKVEMPTAAKNAAMLGVRDGVLLKDDTHPTRDENYFPSHGGSDGRTALTPPAGQDANETRFCDLLFCAIAPTDPADVQRVEAFQYTVDPGIVESNEGMPLLLEGKLYYGANLARGHDGPALWLFTSGQTIKVARIKAPNVTTAPEGTAAQVAKLGAHRTFTEIADADVFAGTPKEYAFVVDDPCGGASGDVAIFMHSSGDYNESTTKPTTTAGLTKVKNWSAGCSVLAHAGTSARYGDFVAVTISPAPANATKIPYLIVSNKYVLSYGEWIAKVQAHPEEKAKPSSVLRKEGLESPRGMDGQYVPSIMTVGFANAALSAASFDKTKLNLQQAVQDSLFTTVAPE